MIFDYKTYNLIIFKISFALCICFLLVATPMYAQDSTATQNTEKSGEPQEPATPANTENNPSNQIPPNAILVNPEQNTNTPSNPIAHLAPVKKPKFKPVKVVEDDKNPFELVDNGTTQPEAEPVATEEDEPEIDINAPRDTAVNPDNPFELVRNGNIAMLDKIEMSAGDKPNKKTKKKKAKKKRKPIFGDAKPNFDAIIKFSALLIIAIFLAYVNNVYRKDMQKIYRAYSNRNMMFHLQREKGSLLQMPYIPLYVLFSISAGSLIYLSLDYFNISFFKNKALSLLACIGGIGGFYLFKHIILSLMREIFPFRKEIDQYQFIIGIYNQILGIALIPFATLVAFAPENIKLYAIYISLVVVAFLFISRLLRALSVANKFIQIHKFHLILYICTVEIAPLFILIKLGMIYG